jgi:O-methyltransferase
MVLKFLKSLVLQTVRSLGYVVLRQGDFERHSARLSSDQAVIASLSGEKANALHRLEEAMDQVRRLTIKMEETPPTDYQALMELIAKQVAFGNLEPEFNSLYERVRPCTMTSIEALYALYSAVKYLYRSGISGDIVECGVWRGGSMMMVALTLLMLGDTSRRLVLFDTFAGHPRPDPDMDTKANYDEWTRRRRTEQSSDWAYASIDEVRTNIESTGYPMGNVALIKGVVEETIVPNAPEAIALLRLDTDWYRSTVHELEQLYPRLGNRGVLIIDDYGAMPGVKQAVDEYFEGKRDAPLLNRVDFTVRLAIKIPDGRDLA